MTTCLRCETSISVGFDFCSPFCSEQGPRPGLLADIEAAASDGVDTDPRWYCPACSTHHVDDCPVSWPSTLDRRITS